MPTPEKYAIVNVGYLIIKMKTKNALNGAWDITNPIKVKILVNSAGRGGDAKYNHDEIEYPTSYDGI